MRPLIGVTAYVERARWNDWDVDAALVPLTYVSAIEHAGGRPLIVPPSDEGVDETLDALDGIIFSGGADLDPGLYGARPHPETGSVRPDRDRSETALMEGALERGLPMLAICRGMQLLNVVKGGDLEQHLPDRTDASHTAVGEFTHHDIEIDAGSRLGGIVGDRRPVPSHHHQAPGRVGGGLRVVAKAPDETIEAVEDPAAAFCVGVLWHPEEGEDRALFEALVQEATIYAKERR
ncbi:MAG: gamma-glutamyl-gamma-aminobutyrate hydrolase family protein [Actinobacteria bacterium]|nr:gamma-glutamyl-gamma-aminobutyrate hydrolase family protein [Actinomycetota bacterium]